MNADVYLYAVPAGVSADPWLRDPTAPAVVVWPLDDKPPIPQRRYPLQPQRSIVAVSLFTDLVGRYGPAEGRRVYFEMESKRQGPFAAGNKYDAAKRRIPRGRGSGDHAPLIHIDVPEARKS